MAGKDVLFLWVFLSPKWSNEDLMKMNGATMDGRAFVTWLAIWADYWTCWSHLLGCQSQCHMVQKYQKNWIRTLLLLLHRQVVCQEQSGMKGSLSAGVWWGGGGWTVLGKNLLVGDIHKSFLSLLWLTTAFPCDHLSEMSCTCSSFHFSHLTCSLHCLCPHHICGSNTHIRVFIYIYQMQLWYILALLTSSI